MFLLFFLFCRWGTGEWVWCFGALPGRDQSLCDGHRGLSDAERADDLKPSIRPRQTVQAEHFPQLQFHGAATRLWKIPLWEQYAGTSGLFLSTIEHAGVW